MTDQGCLQVSLRAVSICPIHADRVSALRKKFCISPVVVFLLGGGGGGRGGGGKPETNSFICI